MSARRPVLRTGSLVMLSMALATPCLAFIRSTLSATDATFLRWDLDETLQTLPNVAGGEILFVIDSAGSDDFAGTEENAAVVRAFKHWEGIGTSRVAFSQAASQAIQVANNDGINAVYWAEGANTRIGGTNTAVDGFVSLTPVFSVASGTNKGLILDANIILNGNDFTWTVTPETLPTAYDVEAHVTHEVGHLIGLDHSGVLSAVMSPRYSSGEARARMLEKDDITGASDIYPYGSFGVTTGAITGLVGRPAAVFGALLTTLDGSGRVIEQSITAANGTYAAPGIEETNCSVYVEPVDKTPASTTNLFDETDLGGIYGASVDPNFFASLETAVAVSPPDTTSGVSFLVGSQTPLINISKIGGRASTIAAVAFKNTPTFVIAGDNNILIGVAGPNIDSASTFEITGTGFTDNGIVSTGSVDGEPYIIKSFSVASNAPVGLRSMRVSRGVLGRTYATGALEVYPSGLSVSVVSPGVFGVVPGEVNSGRLAGQNGMDVTVRGNDIDLSWDDEPAAYGYNIYRGTLASLTTGVYDHQRIPGEINGYCGVSTSYAALAGEALSPVDSYYLVTAWNNAGEGIVGRDSTAALLPPPTTACPTP